jgi:GNAT superfamily N-acetyltransferase
MEEKMNDIIIKVVTCDEYIDKIVDIVIKYREFYKVTTQDILEVKNFMQERIENSESKIFIAINTNTDEIIGFVQLYPLFSTVSLKRQWMLNDFYVLDTERKKGVGTKLMNVVFDYFKGKAKGCILVTEKSNAVAKEFYNKLGWKTDLYDFYTYIF